MRKATRPSTTKKPRPPSQDHPAKQFVNVGLDEMRELEEKAARLERLAQVLLNAPQQAFYVYDYTKQAFLIGQEHVSGLYGYKPGEIEKRPGGWFSIIHRDDLEQFQTLHERLMTSTTNEVHTMRVRVMRKTGGCEWIQVHQRVFERDAKGGVASEVGLVRIITPQVEAEEALRDSKAGWHSLFQNNTAGVLICDGSCRIQDANPMMCRMLKYNRKTLLRLEVDNVIAAGNRASLEKLFRAMNKGGKVPASFETRLEARDGTHVDVLVAATCRRDEAGTFDQCMLDRKSVV